MKETLCVAACVLASLALYAHMFPTSQRGWSVLGFLFFGGLAGLALAGTLSGGKGKGGDNE